MTLILYLTTWPHHYTASFLYFVVKDWNKKHVTNEVQASHMGDYQSSMAAQNIFDVTALEILLASKLQILGQTLPNDELQRYYVPTYLMAHTFVDTKAVQKRMWSPKWVYYCQSKQQFYKDASFSIWFVIQRTLISSGIRIRIFRDPLASSFVEEGCTVTLK